ncbi:MAG: hypothetical protein HW405_401 [Candidatus Berkelbacteria bacterium]|nr:hypothetical protein [Candidatus Berkelbacteria bacterium]
MSKNDNNLRTEFTKTIIQFTTAAFGFVAALAWNETIKQFIDKFISPGSGFVSSLIYAMMVTFIAVFVTYYLGRVAQANKEKEEKK